MWILSQGILSKGILLKGILSKFKKRFISKFEKISLKRGSFKTRNGLSRYEFSQNGLSRFWLSQNGFSQKRLSRNGFSWNGFSQFNCILTWTMYPFWTKYIPLAFTVTLKQTPASGKHVKPTLGRIQTRHFTIFSPTLNCIDVFTGIPRSTVNYVWTPTTKL